MTADPFCDALKRRGIDLGGAGTRLRAVTHLDVSRADIEAAVTAIRAVISEAKR
jgi:threonine aldolase